MEALTFNQEFLDRIKQIEYGYAKRIPEGMKYYISDILKGNNVDMYAKMYSLSINELIMLANVCKVLNIYKDMLELKTMLEQEMSILGNIEFRQFQEMARELQNEGMEALANTTPLEESKEETINSDVGLNLLIYPSYIDESKQRTLNARSGREEQAQKTVANFINQLKMIDYQSLRTKGSIHQMKRAEVNKEYYIRGCAYERFGAYATKVHYVRIPVTENNRKRIKEDFNKDFDTYYLIVYYGDFQNEGYDEFKYYDRVCIDTQRHQEEIESIINIFGTDFTPETYEQAKALINDGFNITEDLTSVLKDKQSSM